MAHIGVTTPCELNPGLLYIVYTVMFNRVACPRIRPKLFSLTVKKFLYLVVAGSLLVLFCRATVWNNGEADWSRNGKFDNNYHSIDSKTIGHILPCQ